MNRRLIHGVIILLLSAGVAAFSGCAAKASLTQMQSQFETLGAMLGRAQICQAVPGGSASFTQESKSRLRAYAEKNGATLEEQASLVSYFEAAILLGAKNTAPCTPDERIHLAQELQRQAKIFE